MNVRDWLIGCGIKPNRDLENALESALQLQRKWCAEKSSKVAIAHEVEHEVDFGLGKSVHDACMNATGEDYGRR